MRLQRRRTNRFTSWSSAARYRAALLGCVVLILAPAAAANAADAGCGGHRAVVPGADRVESACLSDLTTAGTVASGHTDPSDWAGLQALGTENPSGVPGVQVDGYFPTTRPPTPSTAGTTTPSS
ncbi:MAG: hypothetical protein J2P14_11150 [Acidothermales bacterium]|nr:hypothetical protein [Acidothermales bacterium]